jgi:hypothetical protein
VLIASDYPFFTVCDPTYCHLTIIILLPRRGLAKVFALCRALFIEEMVGKFPTHIEEYARVCRNSAPIFWSAVLYYSGNGGMVIFSGVYKRVRSLLVSKHISLLFCFLPFWKSARGS